jgi:uncharacterized protein (DUF1330 family)
MKSYIRTALVLASGIAIGAAAVHGLHAQAKPKAYSVTEVEVIDVKALASYVPTVVADVAVAGGMPVNNPGGKTVALVGEAPMRIVINEWSSLDKAQAFYNSRDWKSLAPLRDKAEKIIRQYIVENPN